MSVIKKIFEFVVNSDSANKKIEETKENLKGATKETQNLNKNAKKTPRALKGVANGFKAIGSAMKAAGIGIVIALVAKLGEAFSKNQKFIDAFATANEFLSRVMNDFVSFLSDNIEPVTDFFKDVFENPLENIKALGNAIKDNIIERIKSTIMVFGLAGKAIKQFMGGDFSAAAETAKQAGKELVDVATGVNDSFDKGKKFIEETSEAIGDYVTETYNAADAQVQLRKNSRLAQAQLEQSILTYQREIEQQKQIRDDISLTIDERIEANEKIGRLLDKQGKEERALAQLRVDAAEADLAANEGNIELKEALIQANTNLADVEERITGFQSEQLTNLESLREERRTNLQELEKIGKSEEQLAQVELKQKLDNQKLLIEKTVSNEEEQDKLLLAAEKEYNDGLAMLEEEKQQTLQDIKNKFIPEDERGLTEAEKFEKERARQREQFKKELEDLKESEEAKAKLLAEFDEQTEDKKKQVEENKLEYAKATKEQEVGAAINGASQIINTLAAQSEAAKGFALAATLFNTYQAVSAALKDETVPSFFVRAINAGVALATGLAQARQLSNTDSKNPTINGGSVRRPNPTVNEGPRFDTVGDSSAVRQAEREASEEAKPQEVFVVSTKVTSQQELDRNKQNNSRFV